MVGADSPSNYLLSVCLQTISQIADKLPCECIVIALAGYVYPASFDRLPFSLPQPNRNSGELRNQMVSAISFIRRSVFRPGYLLERRWYRMLIVWWPVLISGLVTIGAWSRLVLRLARYTVLSIRCMHHPALGLASSFRDFSRVPGKFSFT